MDLLTDATSAIPSGRNVSDCRNHRIYVYRGMIAGTPGTPARRIVARRICAQPNATLSPPDLEY